MGELERCRKIPRTMSTQHPDNVTSPFFAGKSIIEGEDEVREAFYAFSHLGCQEQMWDCEGKEIDEFVVRKLLTDHPHYFRQNVIGRDLFITLRVPNPTVEREEAKVLLETLESIPRSYDTANLFYGEDIAPIFEVILPMTAKVECMNRVFYYYKDFVVGKQGRPFYPGDISIRQWIGEFRPTEVSVIPLFEDKAALLSCHDMVEEYLRDKYLPYMRVFLARSDPAMNYSYVSAVLMLKIALQRLHSLEKRLGIPIYPILGVGSCPFRGNFTPRNFRNTLEGFPAVQTYTVQSAFKYDYPSQLVTEAIRAINDTQRGEPIAVDERRALQIIEKVSAEYHRQIQQIADLINQLAPFIPARRARKLHIGLFGYSREVGGIRLPRAITFCAALYSLGLPPEFLALHVLSKEELQFVREAYPSLDEDLADAGNYYNERGLRMLPSSVRDAIDRAVQIADFQPDREHAALTSEIVENRGEGGRNRLAELIIEAAHRRQFLG